MESSNPARTRTLQAVADRNGVSLDAVENLLGALISGGGTMAQFSHPDLGGMGQWSRGGMVMVGDMFNNQLKYRVDALCTELSNLLASDPTLAPPRGTGTGFGSAWWPEEFGTPSTAGAQNDMRYAFFPQARRLVIAHGDDTAVYDTGEHMISGVSQQQGGGQTLSFTSQFGLVSLAGLQRIGPTPAVTPELQSAPAFAQAPEAAPLSSYVEPASERTAPAQEKVIEPEKAPVPASVSVHREDDVFSKLERLAGLRDKGILTEEEFAAKKAELLSRI